jgi:hypothetical protein
MRNGFDLMKPCGVKMPKVVLLFKDLAFEEWQWV